MEGGLRTKGNKKVSSSDLPLVSIITVVYNRVRYLEQAILSVLNQSYSNIEYIIIDGKSSDGTLDIIKKYENKIDYWVSESDLGMYYALNKGITLAKGELIGICHSDDYYYSNKIVEHLVGVHKVKFADVYHGDAVPLLDSKSEAESIPFKSNAELILETHKSIIHPTTFITKDTLNRFGLYNTRYRSASDYELMIRFKKNGCIFYHMGEIITCLRIFNKDRVSNNCYSHREAYSFHKYHKTGNQNKYLLSYLHCCFRRIVKKFIYSLNLKMQR